MSAGVPGETFGHVFYAINYLNNPDVYELGDKVAIVGAGNAAMDVARTAIRHGARDVTVYVRGDKVAVSENEYNYAVLDGVFASGDVVTGAKIVVAAVAAAKQIADNMDAYMQEKFGNK